MQLPRLDRRLWAAALALATLAAPARAFGVDDLMALLARQEKGEARFTEQRFVRGVDGPLQSAGVLDFEPPDKLVRRTTSPRPESMSVDGNQLVMQRGGRTRTTTLDSLPEVQGMIEAMRGTLMGNALQLQRYFRTKLSGDEKAWTLDLDPIDRALAAQVRSLRITGRGGQVLGVEMEFVGGDRSVMDIVPGAP
ncbi:MAG: outer membrane lipoprotein carrier protein LolA [Xenophilus sp.]